MRRAIFARMIGNELKGLKTTKCAAVVGRVMITVMIMLLFLVVGCNGAVTAFASENDQDDSYSYQHKVIIKDYANVLTESQEAQLKETMQETARYCNVLCETSEFAFNSSAYHAESSYKRELGTLDGVMFLIDMYNRQIYIYSYGEPYKIITKTNAYTITDNVYKYASEEKYFECANEAFKQINTLFAGEKISRPMKHISNILLAIIFSILLNYLLMKKTSKVYDMGSKNLLTGTKVSYNMNLKYDMISETRRTRSGSGGHGGFGGGGFGGGGIGGGGGHSF